VHYQRVLRPKAKDNGPRFPRSLRLDFTLATRSFWLQGAPDRDDERARESRSLPLDNIAQPGSAAISFQESKLGKFPLQVKRLGLAAGDCFKLRAGQPIFRLTPMLANVAFRLGDLEPLPGWNAKVDKASFAINCYEQTRAWIFSTDHFAAQAEAKCTGAIPEHPRPPVGRLSGTQARASSGP
jgi:hypothetical protein